MTFLVFDISLSAPCAGKKSVALSFNCKGEKNQKKSKFKSLVKLISMFKFKFSRYLTWNGKEGKRFSLNPPLL